MIKKEDMVRVNMEAHSILHKAKLAIALHNAAMREGKQDRPIETDVRRIGPLYLMLANAISADAELQQAIREVIDGQPKESSR